MLGTSMSRYRVSAIPSLLRMRLQLALAAAGVTTEVRRATRVAARTANVHALRPTVSPVAIDAARDLVHLLEICHDAEVEGPALKNLVSAVRERSDASTVVLVDRRASVLASAGLPRRALGVVARRTLDSGLLAPPEVTDHGTEAAAPVRYGGEMIGVLVCRWINRPVTDARATGLLLAAAATCAPMVRMILDLANVRPDSEPDEPDLVGTSDPMNEMRRAIRRAAAVPFPVLIEGESGTGKELVARAIHKASARSGVRFCAVNCAALTEDLLEAELFGHVRGAFTGAMADRAGLFEEADGGTLLLDEVGELSLRAQAKLLRVLQEAEIRRVGESFSRRVNVRIIAAANKPLRAEVAAGRFRQDLLYRLDVIRIPVPPLREHPEDIPVLSRHFWTLALRQAGRRATLSPGAVAALARYDWPGNIRELQNVLAALAVETSGRHWIGPRWLPEGITGAAARPVSTLVEARLAFERRFVTGALARAGNRRGLAAADLGLSRQGLVKLLKRHDLA